MHAALRLFSRVWSTGRSRNSFNRAYLTAHVRAHGIVQSPSIVASRGTSPPLHTSMVRGATGPRRLADQKILVQHGSYNKQYHAEYKLLARDVPPHKMLLCLYLSERRSSRPSQSTERAGTGNEDRNIAEQPCPAWPASGAFSSTTS